MASCTRFICGHCARQVEAWSDGNPYFVDEHGDKRYAYHPDHANLARCIGNDVPHLCLACGAEFVVDIRTGDRKCPVCGAIDNVDLCDLEGRRCPTCKEGRFAADPDYFAVS